MLEAPEEGRKRELVWGGLAALGRLFTLRRGLKEHLNGSPGLRDYEAWSVSVILNLGRSPLFWHPLFSLTPLKDLLRL